MDAIKSLSGLIKQFVTVADAYEQLLSVHPSLRPRNLEPLHHIASCASEHLFQIAANLNLSSQAKKAMKVVRNLSSVAFTVRLLIKVNFGHGIAILIPSLTRRSPQGRMHQCSLDLRGTRRLTAPRLKAPNG